MNKLYKYKSKRNFDITNEPSGGKIISLKKLRFVVQHHCSRRDHYDLRLEWNGVLKSFAVPKGPSYNTKDKRLAVSVEDHPLEYRNFEGVIPDKQYGAGPVMIWDEGYWKPIIKPDFNNEIKFELMGKRLKGKWALIRFKDNNFLLIKDKDEYHEYNDINDYNTSIKTGLTMNEIMNNKIKITNKDKIIFKNPKVTKGDIVKYYYKIAERMLPLIENRIISTIRCPNGMSGQIFFKKHFENTDKFLGKKILKNENGKKSDYYYIKDIDGLIKEVQMNSFEFHMWGSKINALEKPDIMVFDFDPDTKLSLKKLREGVKDLKYILDKLNIKSYLKTSGGKGYHVVAKVKSKSWQEHAIIAKNIVTLMEKKWPDKYTANIRKKKREGKIFIDWIRNTRTSTSVAPYSIRLKKKCSVSMPIKWSELDKVKPNDININEAIKRIKRKNPWDGFDKD